MWAAEILDGWCKITRDRASRAIFLIGLKDYKENKPNINDDEINYKDF